MKKTYKELVIMIRDAVREKVLSTPESCVFANSTIHITIRPCCLDADKWLGGLGEFKFLNGSLVSADFVNYESDFTIIPGGYRNPLAFDMEHSHTSYSDATCIAVKTTDKSSFETRDYCESYISARSPISDIKDTDCVSAGARAVVDYFQDKTHPFFKDGFSLHYN